MCLCLQVHCIPPHNLGTKREVMSGMTKGKLIGRGARADVYEWGEQKALKLFHPGASLRWVQNEAWKTKIAHDAGLPVPAVSEVTIVDERHGIILERLAGNTMDRFLMRQPWRVLSLARESANIHQSIHARSAPGLSPLKNGLEQAITRSKVLPEPLASRTLAHLARLPDSQSLLHLDFHAKNLVVTANGTYVIDWDNACIGDPLADVARSYLLMKLAYLHIPDSLTRLTFLAMVELLLWAYVSHYLSITGKSISGIHAWLPVLAAARTAEGFEPEYALLLRMAEQTPAR